MEDVPGQPPRSRTRATPARSSARSATASSCPISLQGDAIFTDLFADLISFRNALNTNDLVGVAAAGANMGSALDTALKARGEIGGRSCRLNLADTWLEDITLQLQTSVSNIEDADITKQVVDMHTRETALRAALAATGHSLTTSLLDFLR